MELRYPDVDIKFPLMQSDVEEYFGEPTDDDFASDYIRQFLLGELKEAFSHVKGGFNNFECHYVMIDPLMAALTEVVAKGLAKQIHTFDGCWVIRPPKSGGMRFSMHAYGLALDLYAATNPFNMSGVLKTDFTDEFIFCFTKNGFDWGGSWSTPKDAMHFQLPWVRVRSGKYAPVVWDLNKFKK